MTNILICETISGMATDPNFFTSSSSNVASVEFIPAADDAGELEATFRSGAVYRYSDVPRSIFEELKAAEDGGSCGKLFNEKVKNGGYDFERVV